MAAPDRDTAYSADGTNRTTTTYTRQSSATGWFVGIIVALALLAIGYLVFSANNQPATTGVEVNNNPALIEPAAPATTPMTETAPVAPVETAPAVPAETAPVAPAEPAPAPVTEAPAAPAQ